MPLRRTRAPETMGFVLRKGGGRARGAVQATANEKSRENHAQGLVVGRHRARESRVRWERLVRQRRRVLHGRRARPPDRRLRAPGRALDHPPAPTRSTLRVPEFRKVRPLGRTGEQAARDVPRSRRAGRGTLHRSLGLERWWMSYSRRSISTRPLWINSCSGTSNQRKQSSKSLRMKLNVFCPINQSCREWLNTWCTGVARRSSRARWGGGRGPA